MEDYGIDDTGHDWILHERYYDLTHNRFMGVHAVKDALRDVSHEVSELAGLAYRLRVVEHDLQLISAAK